MLLLSFFTAIQLIPQTVKFTPTHYETVPDYFIQDNPFTDDTTFDVKSSNFGILPNTSWPQLIEDLTRLNKHSPDNVAYKLIFMARHGEGIHNAAREWFGSRLWKCYWNYQPSNDTTNWFDAELTSKGIEEAKEMKEAWEKQLEYGAPLPQSWYSSPLVRAADTLRLSWGSHYFERGVHPTVKEMLRETYGTHYSDRHHNKSYISTRFPNFKFESGFAEADELWDADYRECKEHRKYRAHKFLNDLFTNDSSVFVSITAHGGIIDSLLKVAHHRKFHLRTGQMIPVIVKAANPKRKKVTYNPILTKSYEPKVSCSTELSSETSSASIVNS